MVEYTAMIRKKMITLSEMVWNCSWRGEGTWQNVKEMDRYGKRRSETTGSIYMNEKIRL